MAEKTEKPTDKKLRDSAEKGQTFKSKDVVSVAVLMAAALCVRAMIDLPDLMRQFLAVAEYGARMSPEMYLRHWTWEFIKLSLPFIAVCAIAGIVPTLFQTRFTLAFKAVKFDLAALNPVAGFKKIFGMRMVKEFVKSLIYLIVVGAVAYLFVLLNRHELFALSGARPVLLGHMWSGLTVRLVWFFLACTTPVLVFDIGVEFYLYYKDLMMEKHEVKQEMKDNEGNPEIKSKRKELSFDLLSEETKAAVEQSSFIVANPTHIAIGIFMNEDIAPLPFISIREVNMKALAAIRYAESKGVPVIRNISLARSIYANCPRRYQFVDTDNLLAVMQILIWLMQVEAANRGWHVGDEPAQEQDAEQQQQNRGGPNDG